jgi:hypothetical protein
MLFIKVKSLIKRIFQSDGPSDKLQLEKMIAYARQRKEAINIIIVSVIQLTINPRNSDKKIKEKFDKESEAYTRRCVKWFRNHFTMTSRTKQAKRMIEP